MIITECPSCKCKHRVAEKVVGIKIACQKCNKKFKVSQVQRKKRIPDFVELALLYKQIDKAQLSKAVAMQQKATDRNLELKDILITSGMISQSKAKMLEGVHNFLEERNLDQKFGQIAIRKNWITDKEVQIALKMQATAFKKTNCCRLIGDILVEADLLTDAQRNTILDEQKRFDQALPNQDESQNTSPKMKLKNWYSESRKKIKEEGFLPFFIQFLQKKAFVVIVAICFLTGSIIFYAAATQPKNFRQTYEGNLISRILHFGGKKYVYDFSFSTNLDDNTFFSLELDVTCENRDGFLEMIKKQDQLRHAFSIVFTPRVKSQIKDEDKLPVTLRKIFKSQLDHKIGKIKIKKYILKETEDS